jgi:hypothetical protein
MDINALATTSIDGGGVSPSLFDQISGFVGAYGQAYIKDKFDNTDDALGEQQANLNAQLAISGQQQKTIIIGVGILAAALIAYAILK